MRGYIIILLITFLGCVNKMEDIEAIYSHQITNDIGLDVEIGYYTKGKLEFQLYAPEIETTNHLEKQNILNELYRKTAASSN